MDFPVVAFAIPLLVAGVVSWFVAGRSWSAHLKAMTIWSSLVLAWFAAIPVTSAAISKYPVEWPGALWPFIALLTAVAWLPTTSKTWIVARSIAIGLLLFGSVYASFPLAGRSLAYQLYPFGLIVFVLLSSLGLKRVAQKGSGRAVLLWVLIAAITPALIFAQMHLGNTQAAGALLVSFGLAAVISWWRQFAWLQQSGQVILLGSLGWLIVNAQLRFDWYSIDAPWESVVLTAAPLLIPAAIWAWVLLDRSTNRKPVLAIVISAALLFAAAGSAMATSIW